MQFLRGAFFHAKTWSNNARVDLQLPLEMFSSSEESIFYAYYARYFFPSPMFDNHNRDRSTKGLNEINSNEIFRGIL